MLNNKARSIRAMILRKTGRYEEAKAVTAAVLADDPLDFLAGNEMYLVLSAMKAPEVASSALADLNRAMRGEVQSYMELAADYMSCGAWDEAIEVLQRPIEAKTPFAAEYPLVHYFLGYLQEQKGNADAAQACYARATSKPSDFCFPFRLETADVLKAAIRAAPADARAYYYLGNLLFEIQPDEAIACWEKSRSLDDGFGMVHRNLGWAYRRVRNDVAKAIDCYEKAIARNPSDPRWYLELDVLYEIGNAEPERRLAMLEKNHEIVGRSQDSLLREIRVLVLVGRYDQAIGYLASNRFHAREGSEGIYDVYMDAHLLRGLARMKAGKLAEALDDFQKASESPESLAAPKNSRRASEISYYTGKAWEGLGDTTKAASFFKQGAGQPGMGAWPATRYCHALCLLQQGDMAGAEKVFDDLIEAGRKRLASVEPVDFFAKFGERQTESARAADAHFAIGLGLLGKGQAKQAGEEFAQAIRMDKSHVWARFYANGR